MFEQLMKMLEELGADVMYDVDDMEDGCLSVTLCDFEGFDDDWSEVMRDYDHEELVAEFEDWLDDHCDHKEGDFYVEYFFDGFSVELGYTSFDI